MKKFIWTILIIAIVVLGWMAFHHPKVEAPVISETHTQIGSASYSCDAGKTITAVYYEGPKAPEVQPGEMPTPTGSAEVSFDGAASTTLMQTISADGARYANSDESLVFWSKGTEALIMRNNTMDLAYTNCKTQ